MLATCRLTEIRGLFHLRQLGRHTRDFKKCNRPVEILRLGLSQCGLRLNYSPCGPRSLSPASKMLGIDHFVLIRSTTTIESMTRSSQTSSAVAFLSLTAQAKGRVSTSRQEWHSGLDET